MKTLKTWAIFFTAIAVLATLPCRAQSQGSDYKGISDPFGDPANYEFADDEKEDKDFFHLGRFLMLGVDTGVGVFTGGLGKTTTPGFYVGAHLIFFFDRSLALEGGLHYSNHLDSTHLNNNTDVLEIDENLIPVTIGLRYYFDTRNAPKAISVANPYLAAGTGGYIRLQNVLQSTGHFASISASSSTTSFGGYAGGGVEFSIYHRHIYMGADLRYHLIFFPDANETYGVSGVDRSGGYGNASLTFTYNF